MKIKVDKKEYEQLLARVKKLEQENTDIRFKLIDTGCELRQQFRDYIERYFTNKCQVVMMKRDKDAIVAELRSQAMDNIFKNREEE